MLLEELFSYKAPCTSEQTMEQNIMGFVFHFDSVDSRVSYCFVNTFSVLAKPLADL